MKAKDLVVCLFDIGSGLTKNAVDICLGLNNELDVAFVHAIDKGDESSEPIDFIECQDWNLFDKDGVELLSNHQIVGSSERFFTQVFKAKTSNALIHGGEGNRHATTLSLERRWCQCRAAH